MYQQIILIGHVGADAEMRYTPAGKAVASFIVATSRKWKDATGQHKEKSVWWRCTVWEKQAEVIAQYVKKGSKVMVVGEVEEARAFTDKAGENRASLEVTASTVKFLDSKGNGDAVAVPVGAPAQDNEAIPFW
jgi:single-strand DNA-binding protein